MKYGDFSSKVVEWYQEHHRSLPWRETRDPYKIWLSEIILQQTRVLQGLPYYLEFVRQYPTVKALAGAAERDILRLWQGLGYYSRARNLRKCAVAVVRNNNGNFPKTFLQLKELPGIGSYTAAAIASFSFDEQVAVVDGNVFRVLARIFGVTENILSSKGRRVFDQLANRLIPATNPGLHNQAVMEFGAIHCTPRDPHCADCVFRRTCVAFREKTQGILPVKSKPRKPIHRYFHYFVVRKNDKLRMSERKNRDIWTGLYDFPLHESKKPLTNEGIRRMVESKDKIFRDPRASYSVSSPYRQTLTHQVIHARFISMAHGKGSINSTHQVGSDSTFYSVNEIAALPKPVLISRYLRDTGFL